MEVLDLKKKIEEKIVDAEKVIIIPHLNADFDAIGSALGVSYIIKKLKKNSFILFADALNDIDPGVKQIIEETKQEYAFIDKKKYETMASDKDLIIYVDVNKKILTCGIECNDKDRTIIIDHHEIGNGTIETDNSYIDIGCSSASEIITNLLDQFKYKIPQNLANYLYAGIYLDTAKLGKNCTHNTMRLCAKLLESGATIDKVNLLFKEEFVSDRRVQDLISKGTEFYNYTTAIVTGANDDEYTKIELAKVADYLLRYGVDMSFAIGKVGNSTVMSARSNGKIDIGIIASMLGGGGRIDAGAVNFNNDEMSPEDAEKKLIKTIKPNYIIDKNDK